MYLMNISDDLLTILEEFVCHIWSIQKQQQQQQKNKANYYSKYQNGKLLIFLLVSSTRANSFSGIWKRFFEANFELPKIADHGWDQNENIYGGLKSPSQKILKKS